MVLVAVVSHRGTAAAPNCLVAPPNCWCDGLVLSHTWVGDPSPSSVTLLHPRREVSTGKAKKRDAWTAWD